MKWKYNIERCSEQCDYCTEKAMYVFRANKFLRRKTGFMCEKHKKEACKPDFSF
jgi:hypothetical protein